MMESSTQWSIILDVMLAFALGGIVGFERELARKPAGLRTHMFVAAAAALLISLGDLIIERFSSTGAVGLINADPTRIIEAVIVGISFLGAGTIIQREKLEQVEGLTTAASLLFVAAIGIAVALEQFILPVVASALALLVNRGVLYIERWLASRAA